MKIDRSQMEAPISPEGSSSPATPPDRLATDPASPYYDALVLERGIGIRFNGVEKTTVEEYSISEGWIRVAAGKARDRRGKPILLKLKGEVVAYFLDLPPPLSPPVPAAA